MRTIIIDARDMGDREALHLVLKDALNLPAYYGRNLDALWDCLRDLPPLRLYLRNAGSLQSLPDGYGQKLLDLLDEAAEEGRGFEFQTVGEGAGV